MNCRQEEQQIRSWEKAISQIVDANISSEIEKYLCKQLGWGEKECQNKQCLPSDSSALIEFLDLYISEHEQNEQKVQNMRKGHIEQMRCLDNRWGEELLKIKADSNQLMKSNGEKQQSIQNLNEQLKQQKQKLANCEQINQQLRSKISYYQAQLEKHEFQISMKECEIRQIWAHIHEALYDSSLVKSGMITNALLNQCYEYEGNNINTLMRRVEVYEQERSMIKILSKLFDQISEYQHQQSNHIQEQEDVAEEHSQSFGDIFNAMKQMQIELIERIRRLAKQLEEQKQSNRSLTEKYARFLKQTQTKIHSLKQKNKAEVAKSQMYEEKQKKLTIEIGSKDNQLQILKRETYDLNSMLSQKANQITQLQLQLEHQRKDEEKNNHLRMEQQQKSNRRIELLTIQIISLKQAISTLKNVMRTQSEKECQPLDASIVQQMIDKTYEIRLSNSELKEEIEKNQLCKIEMKKEIDELKAKMKALQTEEESEKLVCKLKLLESQCHQLRLTVERMKATQVINLEQTARLYHRISFIAEQNTTLQNRIFSLSMQSYEQNRIKQGEFMFGNNLQICSQQFSLLINCTDCTNRSRKRHSVGQLVSVGKLSMKTEEKLNQTVSRNSLNTNTPFEIDDKFQHIPEPSKLKQNIHAWECNTELDCTFPTDNNLAEEALNRTKKQQNLNRTYKLKGAHDGNKGIIGKYVRSIENLNDMINYMISYLKGYTRNGVRRQSWLTSFGEEYLLRVQTAHNIRQKYGNFERVRQICEENSGCQKLIKDFERIANFYLSKMTDLGDVSTILVEQNDLVTLR